MWIQYLNNPCGRNIGDCAVRAVSVALDVDWDTAYKMLADAGRKMCDVMNANSVIGAVLRQHGFYREGLPNFCPDCYTADDFCRDNPVGIYVLGFGSHVATVIDGNIYDSWDSSMEIPQYYWTR